MIYQSIGTVAIVHMTFARCLLLLPRDTGWNEPRHWPNFSSRFERFCQVLWNHRAFVPDKVESGPKDLVDGHGLYDRMAFSREALTCVLWMGQHYQHLFP